MIVRVSDLQRDAILGAMKEIAFAHGAAGISDADVRTIDAAGRIVLGAERVDLDGLDRASPEQLRGVMMSQEDARSSVRVLAVMSLVDGQIDPAKTVLVAAYAAALGVDEDYLRVLAEAAEGEVAAAGACMIRKNAASFPGIDSSGLVTDIMARFMPYRDGDDDPGLEARYLELAHLPVGTFGRAFADHFRDNGFAFPGNPAGLAEGFTTPHDSAHVLSGYSTSQQGELCVSTFIGAMHPDHPMGAEVLPVLFSWHLGIKLNEIAGSSTGAFEPRRFWTAWDRGAHATIDVVDESWDFWSATTVELDELRSRWALPLPERDLLV
ncbi:hypothetical protein [Ilumatobacter sp.]|uniref:hypothetical protein n=1 Tax=Ilumatobacter sp. TaxID=1967498 RepID=UPI003C416487